MDIETLQQQVDGLPHCAPCPTHQGIHYGHDPESRQILTSEDYCRWAAEHTPSIYCPWRQADCVVYPVQMRWAIACHDAGITPPIL
jgi:hypothetical protein